MSSIAWRFCRFALVGLFATALQYAVLTLLVEVSNTRAVIASTVGFIISAIASYLLNRRFTFRSNARHSAAAPRFLMVSAIGLALNAGILGWLLDHTAIHYIAAQLFTTAVVLLWNFSANAVWTFKVAT
jgi:putative flippase GtrA